MVGGSDCGLVEDVIVAVEREREERLERGKGDKI